MNKELKSKIAKIIFPYRRRLRILINSIDPVFGTTRLYKGAFGKTPSYTDPQTINEKLQFLKFHVYNDNDLITRCCDKYLVRDYLDQLGHSDMLPELYGVYDDPSQINWDDLPEQFVVKCNHGSGYNIIVENKDQLNRSETISKLKKWIKEDYWREYAEIQYRHIDKKIIIEEYLGNDLATYKFYCFNGVPKILYIATGYSDKDVHERIDFFDMEFNHLSIKLAGHENADSEIEKPDNFEELKQLAKELAEPFPFVRVDLYDVNGKPYISEFTFIPTGGFMQMVPPGSDIELGKMLDISKEIRRMK